MKNYLGLLLLVSSLSLQAMRVPAKGKEELPIKLIFSERQKLLRKAILENDKHKIKQALEAGSHKNEMIWDSDDKRWTYPLFYALQTENNESLKALLKHGADSTCRHPQGRHSLIEECKEGKYIKGLEILMRYGSSRVIRSITRTLEELKNPKKSRKDKKTLFANKRQRRK